METTDKKGWTKAIDVLEGMESSAKISRHKMHRYREGEVIIRYEGEVIIRYLMTVDRDVFTYLVNGVPANRATVERYVAKQIGNPYLTLTKPLYYDI